MLYLINQAFVFTGRKSNILLSNPINWIELSYSENSYLCCRFIQNSIWKESLGYFFNIKLFESSALWHVGGFSNYSLASTVLFHIKGFVNLFLMHRNIANGHQLLCHAHTVPEQYMGTAAIFIYYSLSSFSAFSFLCLSFWHSYFFSWVPQ